MNRHKNKIVALMAIFILGITGCGGATSQSGEDGTGESGTANAAAVAASLFGAGGSSGSAVVKLKWSHEEGGDCSGDPGCTCEQALSGSVDHEHPIEDGAYDLPGVYGSAENPIDVSEEDFCSLPDGTVNDGMGPDGWGRLATFELTGDIEASCENGDGSVTTIAMQAGSAGLWRNTDATDDEPSYEPQIFGTFNYLIDGSETVTLDCTIYLTGDETMAYANCSDDSGTVVEQAAEADCQIE